MTPTYPPNLSAHANTVWANSEGAPLSDDAHRRIIEQAMRDCGYDGFRILHAMRHLGVHQQQQYPEISETMLKHFGRWLVETTRFYEDRYSGLSTLASAVQDMHETVETGFAH